jgi:exodeoxyribonuclease VII large subunit
LRGEITEMKRYPSGHIYLSLKDQEAKIEAVIWKGSLRNIGTMPENGVEMIATGRISTYADRSKYQLVIERLEYAGEGALLARIEALRKRLLEEGLFDESRKRPLPLLPRVIGVITSEKGAVIQDIRTTIARRFPRHILLWPVAVQGQGAAEQIAAAIRGFSALPAGGAVPRPDVLIVARGGGSLEDLWCFNEEAVVYAVADSKIPVISAVGHETDTTLIDYVSDRRAPTPTAAAEIAVPVIYDLRFKIDDLKNRVAKSMHRVLADKGVLLTGLVRGLPNLTDILGNFEQRLDSWTDRLNNALPNLVIKYEKRLASLQLRPQILLNDIKKLGEKIVDRAERLNKSANIYLEKREQKLISLSKLFDSYNYKNVLARGFALVKGEDGKLIKSAALAPNKMVVEFADGEIRAGKI